MMLGSFDKMIGEHAARILRELHRDEIERAIKNAKRTAEDRWWRRQFYRETAKIAKAYSSHRRKLSGARG